MELFKTFYCIVCTKQVNMIRVCCCGVFHYWGEIPFQLHHFQNERLKMTMIKITTM